MPQRHRLRNQDGFIREVTWVVVILAIIAIVILDSMAIFSAYQSAREDATTAAKEARTEYAQSVNMRAAKLAAEQYLAKSGLDLVEFSTERTEEDTTRFTVTARATADTYAFRYLGAIPQLKKWVNRMTSPVRTGSAE